MRYYHCSNCGIPVKESHSSSMFHRYVHIDGYYECEPRFANARQKLVEKNGRWEYEMDVISEKDIDYYFRSIGR